MLNRFFLWYAPPLLAGVPIAHASQDNLGDYPYKRARSVNFLGAPTRQSAVSVPLRPELPRRTIWSESQPRKDGTELRLKQRTIRHMSIDLKLGHCRIFSSYVIKYVCVDRTELGFIVAYELPFILARYLHDKLRQDSMIRRQ